jgi:ferritin-like metal-binding protein YciE
LLIFPAGKRAIFGPERALINLNGDGGMLLDNLSDLFQRGLEYAWDCEHRLLKTLPKMVEAASSQELKHTLDLHLVESKSHVYRLEQIFTRLDRAPAAEKSEPARIILDECEKMIAHLDRSALLDAALIFSGNQLEHYEISLYGSLAAFARALGLSDAASLLDEALAEEKAADHALTRIAENSVNTAATGVHNRPPFALI